MMIELEKTLHRFNSEHFETVYDFLLTSNSHDRDTLIIACVDHGTAPEHTSFAGLERFFILQHMASTIRSPEDSSEEAALADVEYALHTYDIQHRMLGDASLVIAKRKPFDELIKRPNPDYS